MKFTLSELSQSGAFTGRLVEKPISWTHEGASFNATVFVRPLSFQSAVSDLVSLTGKWDMNAGRIAASICDEHGNPVFTPQDITEGPLDPEALAADPESTKRLGALCQPLTYALLAVIAEVNGTGKTKASAKKTSSGTSSSSTASAARPSRKPRKPSVSKSSARG